MTPAPLTFEEGLMRLFAAIGVVATLVVTGVLTYCMVQVVKKRNAPPDGGKE